MGCIFGTKSPKPPQKPQQKRIETTSSGIEGSIDKPLCAIGESPTHQQINLRKSGEGQNNNKDQQLIMEQARATSKIFRRSSSKDIKTSSIIQEDDEEEETEGNRKSKNQHINILEINLGIDPETSEEIMEGVIKQQTLYSSLTIYTPSIAMQFTIPKSRAGPLLVPYIDYQRYFGQIDFPQF